MDLTVSKKLCLGGSTSSSLSEPSIPGSPSSSVGSNSSSRESSPRTSSSALGEIPNKLTFDQLLALEQLKQQHATQQKPNIVPTLGASLNSQLSSQATSSSAAAAAMLTSLLPPPLRSQFAAAIRLAANSSSQHYDTTNDISSQVLAKVAASLQETDFSSQFAKFAACFLFLFYFSPSQTMYCFSKHSFISLFSILYFKPSDFPLFLLLLIPSTPTSFFHFFLCLLFSQCTMCTL